MGKAFNSINKEYSDEDVFFSRHAFMNGCEKDGELPDKSNCRVKKVTDTLYECLSGTDHCRFLINFGFGKYCTWKLKNSASRLGSHVHAHWEDASERFVI